MGRPTLCEKNMDYLDFWREVEPLLEPLVPANIFYRVYHDDAGRVLFYSMEDLPGNYLDIDHDAYIAADGNARVINGRLVPPSRSSCHKLVPSDRGTDCHPQDVCIVVTEGVSQKWNLQHYE
jgi:hypothetical protein